MSVADLARDASPIADWANVVLERLGVPPTMRQPALVDELCTILRRVVEEQAVQHFTIAKLASPLLRDAGERVGRPQDHGLPRGDNAGRSVAELIAWARAVGRGRAPSSSGEATS
jgi:hypothetical protein